MLTKQKQSGRYSRKARKKRKNPVIKVKESQLQKQLNDTLNAYSVRYIRIENVFWNWLVKMHSAGKCPDEVFFPFVDRFKGMPDNMCFVPIGEKYNLCAALEEKTLTGKQNIDQKEWAREMNVQVLRTTEENENAVKRLLHLAELIII